MTKKIVFKSGPNVPKGSSFGPYRVDIEYAVREEDLDKLVAKGAEIVESKPKKKSGE